MATFSVTNLNDSGAGSLRLAIEQANATPGADSITFDASLSGGTLALTGGELSITDGATIDADIDDDGTPDITIDAQRNSRVLNIDNDSALDFVTLEGLEIVGGVADQGGGIFATGAISIRDSRISDNEAINGGGVFSLQGVEVSGSAIERNTSTEGGGGIQANSVIITNSDVEGNEAGNGNGGGVSTVSGFIVSSTIKGNKLIDGNGAGLHATGGLFIQNSSITANKIFDQGDGGGLHAGSADIFDSEVSGNTAAGFGGGIYSFGKFRGLNLYNSEILENHAALAGGGISVYGLNNPNSLALVGSTVAGNSNELGGLISAAGSGIHLELLIDGHAEIVNSTITDNVSNYGTAAVQLQNYGSLDIRNSTIIGNDGGVEVKPIGSGPAIISVQSSIIDRVTEVPTGINGYFASLGNNLIGSSNSGAFSQPGDLVIGTGEPGLDPAGLQDNGGPTRTIALLPGSLAIDGGANPQGLATDQRGGSFVRTFGDGTDIGAFEFQTTEEYLLLVAGMPGIEGAGNAVSIAHFDALELTEATVALRFTADDVAGVNGLVSKDASQFGDGGHFRIRIEDGDLIARLQNTTTSFELLFEDVEVGRTYDVAVTFEDDIAKLFVDGVEVDQAALFDYSWVQNDEFLLIGADGSRNRPSDPDRLRDIFDGEIEDVFVFGTALDRDKIAGLVAPEGEVFGIDAPLAVANADDVVNVQHADRFALDAGTISFIFNASDVGGIHGIVSKDGIRLGDGGHFSAYIEDGTLVARFQDTVNSEELRFDGVVVGQDYEVDITFAEGVARLFVDDLVVGQTSTVDFSLANNEEFLQIGALGWRSRPNVEDRRDDFERTFEGEIKEFDITDASGRIIAGGPDSDLLFGTDESDFIFGFEGDDQLFDNFGDDIIFGGPGNDFSQPGIGSDAFFGGEGDDVVFGNVGDDLLQGDQGNDFLRGEDGDDLIRGGDGNDRLIGDAGNDRLIGGAGTDEFQFDNQFSIDTDVIEDFEVGTDLIVFFFGAALDAFSDLDTNSSGVLDSGDTGITVDGTGTRIDVSATYGDPTGTQVIDVLGATGLAAEDFLFF